MTTVLALFTCFNRKEKSIHAIESLLSGNPGIDFTFLVVDDGSTDGTAEALRARNFPVRILRGDGSLFYSRGMGMGMDTLLREDTDYDYLYGTSFSLWKDDAVSKYKEYYPLLKEISDSLIVSHRELQDNVFETGYENGIRVIVNYNSQDVQADGITIPA